MCAYKLLSFKVQNSRADFASLCYQKTNWSVFTHRQPTNKLKYKLANGLMLIQTCVFFFFNEINVSAEVMILTQLIWTRG